MAAFKSQNRIYSSAAYEAATKTTSNNLSGLKESTDSVEKWLNDYNAGAIKCLRGEALKIIKNRLRMYEDAFNYYSKVLDKCNEDVSTNNAAMVAMIGNDGEVSDKVIDEARAKLSIAKQDLSSLQKMKEDSEKDTTDRIKSLSILITNVEKTIKEAEEKINAIASEDSKRAGDLDGTATEKLNRLKSFIEGEGGSIGVASSGTSEGDKSSEKDANKKDNQIGNQSDGEAGDQDDGVTGNQGDGVTGDQDNGVTGNQSDGEAGDQDDGVIGNQSDGVTGDQIIDGVKSVVKSGVQGVSSGLGAPGNGQNANVSDSGTGGGSNNADNENAIKEVELDKIEGGPDAADPQNLERIEAIEDNVVKSIFSKPGPYNNI